MKKLLLSLALAGSLFAATQSSDKVIIYDSAEKIALQQTINEKQSIVNQQQSEINLIQEKINNNQIDVNKQNKEEFDNVKSQFNTLKTLIQSNNYGSNGRYTDKKINRLDDKIYRLERNISDHDSRIRKLEMKVR